jgi:ribosomal protein S18 acetylase RimI-like enzyme
MVTIQLVSTAEQLKGIQELQQQNLRKNLTELEATEQGFLMAEYSIDFLQSMHDAAPSVIAVSEGKVVGYSLVALKTIREEHALLADLFNTIDRLSFESKDLSQSNYVVVGQLCVGKGFRGIGLVDQMYQYYRDCYASEYEYLITDVAQDNQRSLKAHQKTGFQVIDELSFEGVGWDIILWDWNK